MLINPSVWLCMCLCCPRRTAVETAATVRRSPRGCEGTACPGLLPYTTEDLICLQFLHICIFKIALYKHWNVYFHYIAMQCILFKVIEMKRTEKRVPIIVLYHVWSMARTDRSTLLKSQTRLSPTDLVHFVGMSRSLFALLFSFSVLVRFHTCTVCTLNICFRRGEQRKFAFADIFIFIFWILFSYGNLDNQMAPFV